MQEDRELKADLLQIVDGSVRPRFHFQPIADLRRAVVAGYEALVRLPVRVPLTADLCLAAAGRLGIQLELEAVMTSHALEARSALPRNAFLCINVSPAFLCSAAWTCGPFSNTDLSGVVIEITEAEFVEDYEFLRKRIAQICVQGGMVAIDDAGAGYASLKHILELKPNFIKLDRNFVHDCATDRAKSTMIEVLGAAADRMDAWVITEGVETALELSELVRLGVPLAQGYFLGKPRETMEDLSPDARALLENLSALRSRSEELLLYAEHCPGVQTREEAEALVCAMVPLVAVTDQWGRPVELLEHHPDLGVQTLPGFMRCQHTCDLREALQRALTRPAGTRFSPILLTDSEGRLRGAVRVDRLMQAVLNGAAQGIMRRSRRVK